LSYGAKGHRYNIPLPLPCPPKIPKPIYERVSSFVAQMRAGGARNSGNFTHKSGEKQTDESGRKSANYCTKLFPKPGTRIGYAMT